MPLARESQPRKRKRGRAFVSVGTKLTGAMLVIVAVVTAFTYFEVNRTEREQLLSAKERSGKIVTELFTTGITAPLAAGDAPGVREHVTLLGANNNIIYAAVWGVHGSHRGDRLAEVIKLPSSRVPAVGEVIPDKVTVERTSDILVVEQPVVSATGGVLGVVRLAFSLQRENELIAAAKQRTLMTALAMGLVLAVVVLVLTRTVIVRRLEQLASAAKQLENGIATSTNTGASFKGFTSNDEVGELSQAFTSMAATIAAREERISVRNRELRHILDNVAEGLMTVRKDGTMSLERSRILDEWFGAPKDPTKFFEYFESFSPTTARWLRLGWLTLADGLMPIDVIFDQMPRRFAHNGKFFELGFLPIWLADELTEDGEQILDEVLVVVSDVTAAENRERAEKAQREAMNIFRRILEDRVGFQEFLRSTSRLVDKIECAAFASAKMSVSVNLRDIHTLKGNTALFGLDGLSEICHAVETRVQEEGGLPTSLEVESICAKWEEVRKIASDLQISSSDQGVELSREEYAEHMRALEMRRPHREILATVQQWANEPASQRLQRIAAQARSIARRIGKTTTHIHVVAQPANLRLEVSQWAPVWTAFSHVLRNTLDHGIETTKERAISGKSPNGQIEITLTSDPETPYIELCVSDDGRGINWEKVRERAARLGLRHQSPADLERALFADALTTLEGNATEMSGRGIGLGAVRDAVVRQCRGEIVIETERGKGTKLRLRLPKPPKASTTPSISPTVLSSFPSPVSVPPPAQSVQHTSLYPGS